MRLAHCGGKPSIVPKHKSSAAANRDEPSLDQLLNLAARETGNDDATHRPKLHLRIASRSHPRERRASPVELLLSFILHLLCGVSVRSSLHAEAPYVAPGQALLKSSDVSSRGQYLTEPIRPAPKLPRTALRVVQHHRGVWSRRGDCWRSCTKLKSPLLYARIPRSKSSLLLESSLGFLKRRVSYQDSHNRRVDILHRQD
jgi:hypothetical protein